MRHYIYFDLYSSSNRIELCVYKNNLVLDRRGYCSGDPAPNKDTPTAQFRLDVRLATPATLTGVRGRPTLASAVGTKR